MPLPHVRLLSFCRFLTLALIALVLGVSPAAAQTPPAIDGDLEDLLQFAEDVEAAGTGCAIILTDPNQDIAVIDPEIIPCVPIVANYYQNGFDQVTAVFVLYQGDLYLGVRTAGVIGDPDGNGNCDTSCPTTNVVEQTGIGTADAYQWFLDTNCGVSFAPNVIITVQNNAVSLSGITAVGQEFDSQTGGHDLEARLGSVQVNGSPLLPLFRARSFVGNTFDGLGEDLSVIGQCPPPNLNLTIEKTANPTQICPGTGTTFTVVVTNPSLVPLQVVLEDELPVGFTYLNGTTTGIGEPTVAANLLTFPQFTLDPGQDITVTFQAQSPEDCSGTVTNLARATGSFTSPCVEGGEPLTVGPITDTADVECVAPSVAIQVGDATTCVGTSGNITIQVTNHSTRTGDVVLVCTPGGQQTLSNLAPDETRQVLLPLSCEEPGQVVVSCTATLTIDDFEGCTAEASDTGTLTCIQAGIQASAEGDAACVGAEAVAVLTVTSTSASIQDVTVNWSVDGVAQTPVLIDNLGPGGSQTVNAPHTCEIAGSVPVQFNVTAAVDGFPECTDEDQASATLTCRQALVAIEVGDGASCVGSPASIEVTVTNNSSEPANLSVHSTFGAGTDDRPFPNVPSGQSRSFTLSIPCSEAGPVPVSSTVTAALVSDPECTAEASDAGTATCAQAGVTLQAQGDEVCVGSEATVNVTVTNTSLDVEDVTIAWTLNGLAQTPIQVNNLAAGSFQVVPVAYQCEEPGSASFAFHATAVLESNPECTAEAEAAAVVECREPGVSISAVDAASCVGEAAQVAVSVTNTGTEAELIVVNWLMDGVPQTPVDLGTVNAGQTRNFNVEVSCTEAGQVGVSFEAVASFGPSEAAINPRNRLVPTGGGAQQVDGCVRTAQTSATVTCRQALVAIVVGDAAACVGAAAQVPITVTNNSSEPANLSVECMINGSPVNQTFNNVPAGASRSMNAEVECEGVGQTTVSCTVTAALVSDPECTAEASDEGVATCTQALVAIVVPDATICVGQETALTVTVTNTSSGAANIAVECTVGQDVQNFNFPNVAAGDSRTFPVTVECTQTGPMVVSCTATSSLVGNEECTAEATDTGTVTCTAACIQATMADAEICVGATATLQLQLSNCSSGVEVVTVTCNIPGLPPVEQVVEVPGGQTVSVPIQVPCTESGAVDVICDVVAALKDHPDCTAEARATARVTCRAPDVEITKSTDPEVTQDDSRVTLVVTNNGVTALDPVQVEDFWPAGLTFDAGSLTSTCGVTATVSSNGTGTKVTFSDFTLNPGQACTIEFDLDCVEFDGTARVDTAIVVAWCDGIDSTDPDNLIYAVRDTAFAPITCEGNPVCPRTIGFWRAQCAQAPNGSTKVCLEGMQNLWRCVITETDVVQFRLNDGTYETRDQLAALSDADLMTRMCAQLEGPRRMTHRDMAELQYLGLMLNLCSGNISGTTPLEGSGGFSGSVGEAVDAIENALNTNTDLNQWKGVADAINNRVGVQAPFCEDENAIYNELPGCAQGSGDLLPSGAPLYTGAGVLLKAYPNPAVNTATQVWFGIPETQAGDPLELRIYDVSGRQLRTLAEQNPGSGLHRVSWDLRDDFGKDVTAGIYFYRLQVGGIQQSERVFVRR